MDKTPNHIHQAFKLIKPIKRPNNSVPLLRIAQIHWVFEIDRNFPAIVLVVVVVVYVYNRRKEQGTNLQTHRNIYSSLPPFRNHCVI